MEYLKKLIEHILMSGTGSTGKYMTTMKKLIFMSIVLCAATGSFVYAATIQIECWGAGGGGGYEGHPNGGGGGAYSRVNAFIVTGSSYTITIAGDASFNTNICLAKGGASGYNGGSGGQASAGIGDVSYSGGNGGSGGAECGSGGSSAGTGSNGNDGNPGVTTGAVVPGGAAVTGGGKGGDCQYGQFNGQNGGFPGGGGGGASSIASPGGGGGGQVVITYLTNSLPGWTGELLPQMEPILFKHLQVMEHLQ